MTSSVATRRVEFFLAVVSDTEFKANSDEVPDGMDAVAVTVDMALAFKRYNEQK